MLSLKKMQLKTKLFLLIGVAVAGLLVVGIVSYFALDKVKIGGAMSNEIRMYSDLDADLVPPNLSPLPMRHLIYRMATETAASDRDKLQDDIAKFQDQKKKFEADYEHWNKVLPEGKVKEAVIVKSAAVTREYIQAVERDVVPAAVAGEKRKVDEAITGLVALATSARIASDDADKVVQDQVAELSKAAEENVKSSLMTLVAIAIITGVVVCVLGIVIVRGILGPLGKTVSVLQALANGDLRERAAVDSQDEIGAMSKALDKAMEDLARIIQSIAGTAEHVASASEEISSSANQQAQAAETQKDQSSQVATAMQEMSSTVMQVSENSNKAAEASRRQRKRPVTAAQSSKRRSRRCGRLPNRWAQRPRRWRNWERVPIRSGTLSA